jgi:hypothetical protein
MTEQKQDKEQLPLLWEKEWYGQNHPNTQVKEPSAIEGRCGRWEAGESRIQG